MDIKTLRQYNDQPAYNEKIMQLAQQVGILDQWSYNRHMLGTTTWQQLEDFAHLLVSECAEVCAQDIIPRPQQANKILQHFGLDQHYAPDLRGLV